MPRFLLKERLRYIAVLADRDKVAMDDEIRDRIDDPKTTRVVTHRGSPVDLGDLDIGNFNGARAIVVLSPEQDDLSLIRSRGHPPIGVAYRLTAEE